jgi:hypothetical protein
VTANRRSACDGWRVSLNCASMKTLRQRRPKDGACNLAAAGHDMALLERNLRLTPAQRVKAHQQALALVRALRQAKVVGRG